MGKPVNKTDQVSYKPLEYTKVWYMKPILLGAQRRADYEAYITLRNMDPNRDGHITRNEFKKHYRLLDWNKFKSSATRLVACSARLRATKDVRQRKTILQQCKAHKRGSVRILKQFSKLGSSKLLSGGNGASYDLGNHWLTIQTATTEVKVQFSRLHPAKSAQQKVRGNRVMLTITHFSGKKTKFVISKSGKIAQLSGRNYAKIRQRTDLTKSKTVPIGGF